MTTTGKDPHDKATIDWLTESSSLDLPPRHTGGDGPCPRCYHGACMYAGTPPPHRDVLADLLRHSR